MTKTNVMIVDASLLLVMKNSTFDLLTDYFAFARLSSNLCYKERRQLKIFLTQIGSVLPLTLDPLVTCFSKWIG
jgi:hypothetical protein